MTCHMNDSNNSPIAPIAKKIDTTVKFGKIKGENRGNNPINPPLEKIDPYYWMRDDSRSDKEILSHLKLENKFTEKNMNNLSQISDEIYTELLSHIQETDTSDPVPKGFFEYYSHTVKGLAYPIHCRRTRNDKKSQEEILLDENQVSDNLGTTQMNVGGLRISPSQKLLAYSVDTSGNETYEIIVNNLEKKETIFKISDIASFEWGSDDKTLFYTKMDSAHRPYQVWKSSLNNSISDELIFQENDELFWVGISKTEDDKFFLISSSSKETSEITFLDLNSKEQDLILIRNREKGVLYSVSKRNNIFYIVTNVDDAKNFQILIAKVNSPSEWSPLIDKEGNSLFKNDESRSISYTFSFEKFLIVFGREKGLKQAWCINFEDNLPINFHQLEFPASAYVVGLGSNLL